MQVDLREVHGNWDRGFALDKHKISSTYTGDNEWGHPQFDTVRTEAGEALFQLKYRSGWDQVPLLAQAVADHIVPLFPKIGLIIPMPASTPRDRQPVSEVADALSAITGIRVFHEILLKEAGGARLKDLPTKEAKVEALMGAFSVNDEITNHGSWNALLLDDLYDTGASAEAACATLRTYSKIKGVYLAALTSKR